MKAAKFAICCLMTILTISFCFPADGAASSFAAAETPRYGRADNKEVYFCKDKDVNTALFAIPYTYCVEIISTDGDWYYVKYAEENDLYCALYGYCKADLLTPVATPPENVYLNMTVPLTFRTDIPSGSLPADSELTVTAAFYGTYYSGGSAYSYVRYDGKFYYILGANDNYPLNEIIPEEPPDDGNNGSVKLIVALVLTGVAVAALIILYFTSRRRFFRPEK